PPPSPGALNAVAFAVSRVGTPYCWGGSGPSCFDCSGLTRASWLAGGKMIPRTSEEQAARLPPVPLELAVPGDILWRPGHVGIYVGAGVVVAAIGRGDVVRYQPASHFVRAVRP
ncbi:MAG TPA: NlpC/P60 family protein, partial [Minicystis sp.]|nr:NlpC/P60 family protein [Minicystis sp.]